MIDFILFIVILFVVLAGGGLVISKGIGNFIFPKEPESDSNITINNYTTEQHLHISKEDLKELSK